MYLYAGFANSSCRSLLSCSWTPRLGFCTQTSHVYLAVSQIPLLSRQFLEKERAIHLLLFQICPLRSFCGPEMASHVVYRSAAGVKFLIGLRPPSLPSCGVLSDFCSSLHARFTWFRFNGLVHVEIFRSFCSLSLRRWAW